MHINRGEASGVEGFSIPPVVKIVHFSISSNFFGAHMVVEVEWFWEFDLSCFFLLAAFASEYCEFMENEHNYVFGPIGLSQVS